MADLPLSDVIIQPAPASSTSKFVFSAPAGSSPVEVIVQVEKGGLLEYLLVEGTFTSYQVIIKDESLTASAPLENVDGDDTFVPGQENLFNKDLEDNEQIYIVFQGPAEGFDVSIEKFKLCLPEMRFCQLTKDEVLRELSFLPLNGVLGVSPDDNEEVNYGLTGPGDTLEEGTKVQGNCYVCECVNYVLECTVDPECEKCPNYTATCEGSCDNPELVFDFENPGVDPSCVANETCVPDGCTTPHNCPSPWGEWSECDQCVKQRTRTCDESCGSLCNNIQLSEVEQCEPCVTVPPPVQCDENEELKCYNTFVMCNESCKMRLDQDSCNSLIADEDLPCNESCACKDGFMRNQAGVCVEEQECECYNGTVALPMNYRENVSACKYCICAETGYECYTIDDCCELGEWSGWSECSVTCGQGIKTRTREQTGMGCDAEKLLETEDCMENECPCIYMGKEYAPDEIIDDECKYCKCDSGSMQCEPKNNPDTWQTDDCQETCYCGENGEMVCTNTSKPECEEIRNNCNNDTHMLEDNPDDPCCPKCVPRMKPCEDKVVGSTKLNYTSTNSGLCISEDIEIKVCEGSCGFSSSGGNYFASYSQDPIKPPAFDMNTYSDCKCCNANLVVKEVSFNCADESVTKISVTSIGSCSCMQCT
ncbi:SCO-spondin [Aplysia californica]|uniref:SCO-spondin n=1 Tax=Aplysia californica TaxID=6500 RepID=A0ABM0K331_APLCA|nr:SCO-spondin [Aplysia californica]